FLVDPDAPRLKDIAYTLQVGRRALRWRRAFIARTNVQAAQFCLNTHDPQAPIARAERRMSLVEFDRGFASMSAGELARTGTVLTRALPALRQSLEDHAVSLAMPLAREVLAVIDGAPPGSLEAQVVARTALTNCIAQTWRRLGAENANIEADDTDPSLVFVDP